MTSGMVARRAEMREGVFFDGPDIGRKISRFWMLLVLAAIIASAGVIADSEATVIGAMIVYFATAFGLGGADLGMIRRNVRRGSTAGATTEPE